jgi:hypothetical protein
MRMQLTEVAKIASNVRVHRHPSCGPMLGRLGSETDGISWLAIIIQERLDPHQGEF